ncbi:hypothetical protein [Raineyella sp. W15-4]|uniref:hypothetical protein n=1 Tax=Raineyella sp. W15-4 TaxID=3081651 RepID=UPI002952ADAA|nr:hypothetical protein [Raineyella sp. W15-4]WOQ15637.1 hypothetical protein R0145_10335 [Raineyella sp. W15-4]
MMWLPDLERLIFGAQLSLEDVSAVEDVFDEARQVLAELAAMAPVTDLAERRDRRQQSGGAGPRRGVR